MSKISDNILDDIFIHSEEGEFEDASEELGEILAINMDEINDNAKKEAANIVERLSDYYFDEKYLENHPYIKPKIAQEINNIRRLLKMLVVNETAQDSLIKTISAFSGKGTLYSSLTTLQNAMLNIQTKLNETTSSIEKIFSDMQAECEKTWEEKDKEIADDGSVTTRGSRDFLKELNKDIELELQNINKEDTEQIYNINYEKSI